MTQTAFQDMNLDEKIQKALDLMGFENPTEVQAQAIPIIREGNDVFAKSQTGTGKTLAFAIPAIEAINYEADKAQIEVLVLCPTRELAMQAHEEVLKIGRFFEQLRPVCIYGGASIEKQCISLRKANMVIGTPGRIMDHMSRKTIKLENLKMLVLDEADEMLNMGFREDIETILENANNDRQTVLFSATLPPAIKKITEEFQKDPVMVEVASEQLTVDRIEQNYIDVPHVHKKDALIMMLQYFRPNRALIFSGTKKMADDLKVILAGIRMNSEVLHSDIKQAQRTQTMQDYKAGKTPVLIATDIAARGIDVDDIDFVINYDVPPNSEYYVHRIGRTGRAGKKGTAITICSSRKDVDELRRIGRETNSEIKQMAVPTNDDLETVNLDRAADRLRSVLKYPSKDIYKALFALMEAEFTYEEIALGALSVAFRELGAPKKQTDFNVFKHEKGELVKKSPRTGSRNGGGSGSSRGGGSSSRSHSHSKTGSGSRAGFSKKPSTPKPKKEEDKPWNFKKKAKGKRK